MLSDDLWRYVHDGRQLATGNNPYAKSPVELGAGHSVDPILERINHPDLVTIYQPTSQYTFSLLWRLRPQRLDPLGIYTFRLGFVFVDLAMVALVLYGLARVGRSLWWAVLYAWHPLVVSEISGSGHQDVIGMALLWAGFMACGGLTVKHSHNEDNPSDGRMGALAGVVAGVCFSATGAVKPFVLPLGLAMAWRKRRHRAWLRSAVVAAGLTLVGLYLPFVLLGEGMGRFFDTAGVFVRTWSFNSSAHGLISWLVGSKHVADQAVVLILLAGIAAAVWRGVDFPRLAKGFFFACFLLSSTAHPWYLLWAVVFLPLGFDAALWVMSGTVAASYAVLVDPAQWQLPMWLSVAQYLPVYTVLAYLLIRCNRNRNEIDKTPINEPARGSWVARRASGR